MGFGRDTRNKILAVSHFQSRIGSDQDYSDPGYSQAQVDFDEYAVMDLPQAEYGLKLRGLTERKKRRSSATTAAPRPQPPNHNSSSSSAGQTSYYPAQNQSNFAQGSAAYLQSPMQGSPPPMHNSTFIPPSGQYQSCNPNQGYAYANANQSYQNQGQQHHQQYQQQQQQQQQPQYYNQGYNQTYNQYTAQPQYPPASQSHPAQSTQPEYWVCNHGWNIAIHRPYCPNGCVRFIMSGVNG